MAFLGPQGFKKPRVRGRTRGSSLARAFTLTAAVAMMWLMALTAIAETSREYQIKAAFVCVRANLVNVFGFTHFLRGSKVCALPRHQN